MSKAGSQALSSYIMNYRRNVQDAEQQLVSIGAAMEQREKEIFENREKQGKIDEAYGIPPPLLC